MSVTELPPRIEYGKGPEATEAAFHELVSAIYDPSVDTMILAEKAALMQVHDPEVLGGHMNRLYAGALNAAMEQKGDTFRWEIVAGAYASGMTDAKVVSNKIYGDSEVRPLQHHKVALALQTLAETKVAQGKSKDVDEVANTAIRIAEIVTGKQLSAAMIEQYNKPVVQELRKPHKMTGKVAAAVAGTLLATTIPAAADAPTDAERMQGYGINQSQSVNETKSNNSRPAADEQAAQRRASRDNAPQADTKPGIRVEEAVAAPNAQEPEVSRVTLSGRSTRAALGGFVVKAPAEGPGTVAATMSVGLKPSRLVVSNPVEAPGTVAASMRVSSANLGSSVTRAVTPEAVTEMIRTGRVGAASQTYEKIAAGTEPVQVGNKSEVLQVVKELTRETKARIEDPTVSDEERTGLRLVIAELEAIVHNPTVAVGVDGKSEEAKALINQTNTVIEGHPDVRNTKAQRENVLRELDERGVDLSSYPEEAREAIIRDYAHLKLSNMTPEEREAAKPQELRDIEAAEKKAAEEKAAAEKKAAEEKAAAEKKAAEEAAAAAEEAKKKADAAQASPESAHSIEVGLLHQAIDKAAEKHGWSGKKVEFAKLFSEPMIANGGNLATLSGVMGNVEPESDGYKSDVNEYGNGIGFGYVQWSFERRDRLEAEAAAQGVSPADPRFQANHIVKESMERSQRDNKNANEWAGLVAIKSPAEAADYFRWNFERPNERLSQADKRVRIANEIFEQLSPELEQLYSNQAEQAAAEVAAAEAAAMEAKAANEAAAVAAAEQAAMVNAEAAEQSGTLDALLAQLPAPMAGQGSGNKYGMGTNTEISIPGFEEKLEKLVYYTATDQGQAELLATLDEANPFGKNAELFCGGTIARLLGQPNSGYGTAIAHYQSLKSRGLMNFDNNPPVGALVYFAPNEYNKGAGHIGIYVGDGKIITNNTANGGTVDVMWASYFGESIGWVDSSIAYDNSARA